MAIEHKLLEKIEAFKDFSEIQLAKVKNLCAEIVFNENDRLFAEGDPATHLWLVIDGRVDLRFELPVKQFATAEQTVFTVKITPQKPMTETLGWSCFVSPYRMRLSAYCASPACRIIRIPKEELLRIFEDDPLMGYRFMAYMVTIVGYRFHQFQDVVATRRFLGYGAKAKS
jgi:CRP-like cAMP-binding protein